MKKYLLFFAAASIMVLFAACGQKKVGSITIDSKNCDNVVSWDFDDFFEIKCGKYPIELKDGMLSITLSFRVMEKADKSEFEDLAFDNFDLEFYDENDKAMSIRELQAVDGEMKFQKLLDASVGSVIDVTFVGGNGDEATLKELASKAKSVYVGVDLNEKESSDVEAKSKKGKDLDEDMEDYEKALELSKKSLEMAKEATETYGDVMDAYGDMFD